MGILDWLFSVEIEEEKQDELYPEKHEDDPEAPERIHDEVNGFDERFSEDAQTETVERGSDSDENSDLPTDTPYELEPTEQDEEDESEY